MCASPVPLYKLLIYNVLKKIVCAKPDKRRTEVANSSEDSFIVFWLYGYARNLRNVDTFAQISRALENEERPFSQTNTGAPFACWAKLEFYWVWLSL